MEIEPSWTDEPKSSRRVIFVLITPHLERNIFAKDRSRISAARGRYNKCTDLARAQ